jgi:molybdopterin-containing oxidoreductase family iron-sulfur binding subunit
MNDDLGRMVLNRCECSRGMEKCSMYSNDTSDNAKNEGRPVVDGEFQTACSNACSQGAMKRYK